MKSLKEYIAEGLLDRVKNKEVNHEAIIKEFLKDNYKINGSYTIKGTKDGFIVDVKGSAIVKNKNIVTLTNEFFEFGEVSYDFFCDSCPLLKTLEGAPKEVGYFLCNNCKSLRTLEGAPQKVGKDFYCDNCESLTTLEGDPKEVGGHFLCNDCESLRSLKGAPKKVGKDFNCSYCDSLRALKGAPKEVGGSFQSSNCGIEFTEEDVKKHTTVAKKIYI